MAKFVAFLVVFGCSLAFANSGAYGASKIKGFLHEGTCQLDQVPENRVGRSAVALSADFGSHEYDRRSFSIEIQIYADGTYWAHYQEFITPSELAGAEWSAADLNRVIEGKWHVVNNRLEFSGLGSGLLSEDPSGNVDLRFTLEYKLVSDSAVGVSANLNAYRTYMGPKRACDMRTIDMRTIQN